MNPPETREAIANARHLLASGATLVIAVIVALTLFDLRWQRSALADIHEQPGGWIGAVIIVACSAVAHELLHGLSWIILGRVSRQAVSLRPSWRGMGLVTHFNRPIPARAEVISHPSEVGCQFVPDEAGAIASAIFSKLFVAAVARVTVLVRKATSLW